MLALRAEMEREVGFGVRTGFSKRSVSFPENLEHDPPTGQM
uniref:Uncharacterized protein n=1 Tax=Candidatus Kentrum sp. UNK TaxID=2126344 RepID=A0A451A4B9_9GAMM|nr:MAG: hypothetical protein BECKUNK1418G_GA0071005_101411 [Candidatus Kentron sp. UNK]VFK69535.1 MAG: hypothetical protein BECKUNK1418H_GA0071006_101534 [Candidatus Kentron sp. UNK]